MTTPPGFTGADALLATAAAAGIEVCFANPGTTEIPLVAAFARQRAIRPVLCVFEGVCSGAADGQGRGARKPAAATDDQALNALCDARLKEPRHPLQELLHRLGHELEQ